MKSLSRIALPCLIGLIAFLQVVTALAANSPKLSIKEIDVSTYPRVIIDFGVEGLTSGAALPKGDFALFENGRPVRQFDIETVSSVQAGMAVALVVDTSGSMAGKPLADAKSAAATFIQKSPPGDQLAVVGFGSQPKIFSPLTGDKKQLLAAVGKLQAGGETALYDGLKTGVDLLVATGSPRKNLIVLSDGGDTASKALPQTIVSQAKAGKISIYAVALKTADYAGKTLENVAGPTDGKVILAPTSAALVPFYAQLARDLQSQYRLVFDGQKSRNAQNNYSIQLRMGGVDHKAVASVKNPAPISHAKPAGEDLMKSPTQKASPQSGGLDPIIFLIAGIAFASTSLIGFLLLAFVLREPSPLQTQLRFYEEVWKRQTATRRPEEEGNVTAALMDIVSDIAAKRGFTGTAHRMLEQAGLPLRPAEYMVFHFGAVLLAGLMVYFLTKTLVLAIFGIFVATLIPFIVLQLMTRARANAFHSQLPDTLGIMAGSLRAGYSLLQAVTAVVDEARPPISVEFRRVLAETRLGLPLEVALEKMAERVGSESFTWTVMAINIQREVGGNLAEVLDILAETLRDRDRIRRQIKTLTAEGRLSAIILIALPFGQAILLYVINPEYMSLLFTNPIGWMMSFMAVLFMGVGIFWVKSIVSIEV